LINLRTPTLNYLFHPTCNMMRKCNLMKTTSPFTLPNLKNTSVTSLLSWHKERRTPMLQSVLFHWTLWPIKSSRRDPLTSKTCQPQTSSIKVSRVTKLLRMKLSLLKKICIKNSRSLLLRDTSTICTIPVKENEALGFVRYYKIFSNCKMFK